MAGKRTSKTRWGWIAFATGLAICVVAGGVIGAMLGKSGNGSDADEVQRVAALALDTSRLNDDALNLSRAIEEAVARDELESEAETLRAELARLETRAERIRVRAESQRSAGQGAELVREREARRGLKKINATLAVFERDVVARLESVLSSQPSPEPSTGEASEPPAGEALADVMLVLEEQGRALTNLTNDLAAIHQDTETMASQDFGQEEEPADLVSGSFESALIRPGFTLGVGYELQDFDAEVEAAGAEPGRAMVTSLASGKLTVTNTTPGRSASFELPTLQVVLYWKELEVPGITSDWEIGTNPPEETAGVPDETAGVPEEASFEGGTPCRYEFDGDRYCVLAGFAFAEAEPGPDGSTESTLEPGGEIDVDVLEASRSLLVGEAEADVVADFIGSGRPDLVQVLAVSPDSDLRPACMDHSTEPEGGEHSEVNGSTLGFLGGDGTVIFEAPEPDQPMRTDVAGNPEMPECYTVLDE